MGVLAKKDVNFDFSPLLNNVKIWPIMDLYMVNDENVFWYTAVSCHLQTLSLDRRSTSSFYIIYFMSVSVVLL